MVVSREIYYRIMKKINEINEDENYSEKTERKSVIPRRGSITVFL